MSQLTVNYRFLSEQSSPFDGRDYIRCYISLKAKAIYCLECWSAGKQVLYTYRVAVILLVNNKRGVELGETKLLNAFYHINICKRMLGSCSLFQMHFISKIIEFRNKKVLIYKNWHHKQKFSCLEVFSKQKCDLLKT